MSTLVTPNLDYIQNVVSARYGGPAHGKGSTRLSPNEQAALRTWTNRLSRAEAANRQIVLPNGALVWA